MGRLTLCGPSEEMWTLVGDMIIGAIVSGRGAIYVDKGAGLHNQNWGFSSSTTLKPNGQ